MNKLYLIRVKDSSSTAVISSLATGTVPYLFETKELAQVEIQENKKFSEHAHEAVAVGIHLDGCIKRLEKKLEKAEKENKMLWGKIKQGVEILQKNKNMEEKQEGKQECCEAFDGGGFAFCHQCGFKYE